MSAPTGESLRDMGMASVRRNNPDWHADALDYCLFALAAGDEITGDDIRRMVERSVGDPDNSNSWGALTAAMVRAERLIPTGRYVKTVRVSGHARAVQVYRVGGA